MFSNFNLRKNFKPQASKAQPVLTESAKTLLEPKTVEINGCKFIISKMPCTIAQEVIFNMPSGLIPIISDFKRAEEQAFKMLARCERVYPDGRSVPLISKDIIDNNVPDFKTLRELEWKCFEYNYDFFQDGSALTFLNTAASLVKSNLSEILTDFLERLSAQAGQASMSSKTDTL